MKNYQYYPQFDENECLFWRIRERATSQVVAEFFFEDDAQEYCEFLESGGAFAGFTPSFIIRSVASGDINEAFEATFT